MASTQKREWPQTKGRSGRSLFCLLLVRVRQDSGKVGTREFKNAFHPSHEIQTTIKPEEGCFLQISIVSFRAIKG